MYSPDVGRDCFVDWQMIGAEETVQVIVSNNGRNKLGFIVQIKCSMTILVA